MAPTPKQVLAQLEALGNERVGKGSARLDRFERELGNAAPSAIPALVARKA